MGQRITGLCLTRREGETIVIVTEQGRIEFTLGNFIGGQVRIKFVCPEDIKIFRKESFERRGGRPYGENREEIT